MPKLLSHIPNSVKGNIILLAQKGGEIDPVLNEVKDAYNFIKSYHYSPKFEERYRNMYANDLLYNTKHEDHFIDYYSNIIPTIQNPQLKKEYEDQLRYYQKERDESLKKLDEKVDLSVSTARNKLKDLSFFTLRGEERQPWSDRIIRSFKGRPNPEGVETGSHYNTANNIAFIYKDQLKDEYGNLGSIAAHEFSHAVSSHIPYSIDMILKQSKMLTNPRDEHDVAFDETKSDIDALRYLLNKNKIYDTRTQDFTKEHLQRAKKTIKDFSFDRLQRLYNDDDLIELMNIIAANDNNKKEPITIAKKGGVVKSNELLTFTEDNGWLNKYQEGGTIPKAQEGTIFNKTNTQMKNTFATGGQMRKATNSQFLPSYVNGVPVYGFGSWLKKNAGNVLQVAGGVGAMFIPGMQGIGATLIGNGVTGALGQELQDKQQKDAEAMQRADAERSFMLNQYNDSQQVFASPEGFAKGGSIHIDPSKRGTFTAAATKHGQSVQGFASQVLANKDKYSPAMVKKAVFAHNFAKANGGFVPTYEQGGFMNGLKFYNDGGDIDGLTYFPVGGTHESNPNNGIPLGGNALVEEGEFMWESPTRGKYIFSNRF